MTKFCPVCGTPNEDSAHFCVRCGYNFDVQAAQPNQQSQVPTSPQPYAFQQPNITVGGDLLGKLDSLRSAFFWLFIGAILSIIPLVGIAGAIIAFVGFILLIIGFGNISKSSLPHAQQYANTKKWLLAALILAIIFIISMFFIVLAVFTVTATVSTTSTTSPASPFNTGILITVAYIIITILYIIIYIIAYLKLVNSLKSLSSDIQVKKLYNSGNYLLYSLILAIIAVVLLPVILFIATSSFSTFSTTGLTLGQLYSLLGALAIPLILALVGFVLEIIAYYSAYKGIDEFKSRYGFMGPYPSQPPQMPPAPPIQ